MYGKSSLRKVDPGTGEVLAKASLDKKYFAEGMCIVGNYIYMLTWKESTLLIYDKNTLELVGLKNYRTHTGEGWGITYDGTNLIVSDGSNFLMTYRMPSDPTTSEELVQLRKIRVVDPETDADIRHVNELEYVDGYVYANLWYKVG